MLKKILHITLILGITFKCSAQNFVWNKTFGGNHSDVLQSFCESGSKNFIYCIISTFDNINNSSATLKLDTINLVSKNKIGYFLIKFDTSGGVIWAKKIFEDFNGKPVNLTSDFNDNIYIVGDVGKNDSAKIFSNSQLIVTESKFQRKSYIIKLDKIGNFVEQTIMDNVQNGSSNPLTIINNSIFYSCRMVTDTFIMNSDIVVKSRYIYIKFDTSFNYKYTIPCGVGNYVNSGHIFKDKDSLVFFTRIISDSFSLGNILILSNFSAQYGHLLKITVKESNGDFVRVMKLTKGQGAVFTLNSCSQIGDKYGLVGSYKDSLPLNDLKYPFVGTTFNLSNFAIILKGDKILSSLFSKSLNNKSGGQFLFSGSTLNHLYMGGNSNGDINFNGIKTNRKEGSNIYCKLDTLCNILWFVRCGDSIGSFQSNGFCIDQNKGVYFGTTFQKNIELGGKTYYSNNGSKDFILSKIYDFSITRGNVSKGPYCAGDSFIVPYKKDGNYDTANFFIAEISDEEGNFNGGQRELGRLKTNTDSIIMGKLPLFDVPTSPDYRIRIISTKPQVQSYYRLDSLRFLIYSKDRAYAGKDTTICYGTQLPIKTSGGSQWRWSPGYMVVDSTSRNTDTKPIVNPTRFRIIISDSSGCGKIDTAYKWVYPLQALKILNIDTIVCRGSAKISFRKSGGVPPFFQYQWLTIDKKLLAATPTFTIEDTTPLQLLMVVSDACSYNDSLLINVKRYDSLKLSLTHDTSICKALPVKITAVTKGGIGNYKYKWRNNLNQIVSINDTLKLDNRNNSMFSVSVADNCTNPVDSQAVRIDLYEPLTFKVPNDTQLCYNNKFNIKPVIITGVKAGSYWFTFDNGFRKDSLLAEQTIKAFNYPSTIMVKAKNLCNEIITNSFNVNVLQKLKLNGADDVELCKGNLLNLKINASGGLNPKIKWLENNNNLISLSNQIDTGFNVKSSTKFTFIGFDNCSVPNDTVNMNLTVLPELKVNIQDPPYCFKDAVNLKAKITGGKVSDYQINWQDANGSVGIDSLLFYNTDNNIQTLYFSLKDNCSVPYFDTIVLIPMSIAKIDINDSSQCFKDNYFDLLNQFDNVKGSSAKSDWYYSSEFIPSAKDSSRLTGTFNTSGIYNFKLIVRSKGLCLDSSQVLAEVYPVPFIKITWKRTTNNFAFSTWRYEANSTEPIKNYTWFVNQFAPQAGNPVFQDIDSAGHVRVKLIGEDFNNCLYDTIINYEMVHRLQFYIPNIITMNGDGVNDNFVIHGKEYMKTYHLEIYNRWGEKVFQSDNPDEAWIPNDFSNNIYNYMLSILDVYDEKHLVTGAFGVLR